MEKVKLAVIGCGGTMRWMYGPYFEHLENGELVAVMDADEQRAIETGEEYGVEAYADLETMLDEAPCDAVMVGTPTHAHCETVVAAAQAGKHVYCEKPMAPTLAEADGMIDACNDANVKLMVGYMKRFNESFQKAREVIASGGLGDVFELRCVWDNARATASTDNYRHRVESGGGYLQEDGSHPLDICRWWLGDVRQVSAEPMIVASDRLENDDVAAVVMRHASGAMSSLHITMLTHRRGLESYEVFGTEGTLLVECPYHSSKTLEPPIMRVYRKSVQREDITAWTDWNPQREYADNWQYGAELRHFCDCVIEDRAPVVGGEEGRAVVEILSAAYKSAAEGTKVSLPLQESYDMRPYLRQAREESPWALGDDVWLSRY